MFVNPNPIISDRIKLDSGQKKSIKLAKEQLKICLSNEMGFGKTVCALTISSELIKEGKISKILLVCPKGVIKTTWTTEMQKWNHVQNLKFQEFSHDLGRYGNMKDHNVMVVSAESLTALMKKPYFNIFDGLIIDESTKFKSPDAKRFNALVKLAKTFKMVLLMSANPLTESLFDIWSQTRLMGSDVLGETKKAFRSIVKAKPKDICPIEFVYKKVQHLFTRFESQAKKPPLLIKKVKIQPTKTLMQKMMTLDTYGIYKSKNNETFSYTHPACLKAKRKQLASGFIYLNTEEEMLDENFNEEQHSREADIVHKLKVKAIKSIIESEGNKPVIIVYNYVGELSLIQKAFPKAVEFNHKQDVVDNWNNKKIKILLLHPMSAGHGLNLQYGGHIMIFSSYPYSIEQRRQVIGRIHRRDQKESVVVYDLEIIASVEEEIASSLEDKHAGMVAFKKLSTEKKEHPKTILFRRLFASTHS